MVDKEIISFLTKLHISAEAAKVYVELSGHTPRTAQWVSKRTGIPKTTIYRRLDELKQTGLVHEHIDEFKKMFTTASIDQIQMLLIQREQEVAELRLQLPVVTKLLKDKATNFDPETKVLFYRGRDGIRQMLWNVLHAKSELVGYTFRDFSLFVGAKFYDSWYQEFIKRKIRARDLYSDEYIKSRFELPDPDRVKWSFWESRYIPPSKLNIQHQMDIYDNVVGIYNWVGTDIFGIEIHNDKVANLQRQLFTSLWSGAVRQDFEDARELFQSLK